MRLLLLLSALAAAGGALALRVWGAAIAAFVLALALLPQVVVATRATINGERQPEPRLYLPVSLSRAQQFVAGMVVVGVPLIVWRVIQDGWVAVAFTPLLVIWVIWVVMLIRREGWSGHNTSGE